MSTFRQSALQFLRKRIPRRVKGWLYKLSIAENQEGSIYFHVNKLRILGYTPDLVVDLGAFRGEWTTHVLPIFPKAKFMMVEPQDDKASLLAEIVRQHPNVSYRKTLVGRAPQERVEFYEMESGSSIYEERTEHPRVLKGYSMTTLDSLLAGNEADKEIFLKMDVQGAELDVLEGASETLKRCNFLLLEASVLNYNEGAPLFAELVRYLDDHGFELFDVCDLRRKKDGVLIQVDLIFCSKTSVLRAQLNFPERKRA